MTIVNHENILGVTVNGQRCVTNSIFIPTSQNFKIATLGLAYIAGLKENPKPERVVAQLLDYRCHLPTPLMTELGTDYPDEVRRYLQWLAIEDPKNVASLYNLATQKHAEMLIIRADDMLKRGFEWTISNGDRVLPSNHNTYGKKSRYNSSWPDVCCNMVADDDTGELACKL